MSIKFEVVRVEVLETIQGDGLEGSGNYSRTVQVGLGEQGTATSAARDSRAGAPDAPS